SANVATDQVRIHCFEFRGRENPARQNAFSKSWCKALDLVFNFRQHVSLRSVWNVAVCPGDVFTLRGSRRIKNARLHQQHNGRSEIWPFLIVFSEAAISSKLPPRWSVAA